MMNSFGRRQWYATEFIVMCLISSLNAENCTDSDLGEPKIFGGSREFLENETFTINCTVDYQKDSWVKITWKFPPNVTTETINETTNEHELTSGMINVYKNITIRNATKEHAGRYRCTAHNKCGEFSHSFKKKYLEKAQLKLTPPQGTKSPMEVKMNVVTLSIAITAYPAATFQFLRNSLPLPRNESKYKVIQPDITGDAILTITNATITDSANYTVFATNGYLNKTYTYDLRVKANPTIDFGPNDVKKFVKNTIQKFRCTVIGYPLPVISWIFSNGDELQTMPSSSIEMKSVYEETALLSLPVHESGNISCKASNTEGESTETRTILAYEMYNGFGIKNAQDTWFPEHQDVIITCIASKYDFVGVTWLGSDDRDLNGTGAVENTNNSLSLIANLKFSNISLSQSGQYSCRGIRLNGSVKTESISISVAPLQAPVITNPIADQNLEVLLYHPVQFTCQAEGVPPPELEWHKNQNVLVFNDTNAKIYTQIINHTVINSTIFINKTKNEYEGVYECIASNDALNDTRVYSLVLKEQVSYAPYLVVILVITIILTFLVLYLMWKVRKEKRLRKEAGLYHFREGAPKSLDPTLGIDEQADKLPYDERFEFPANKLIRGRRLGSGAFGVVFKAEARGIINAEETTEVAVKMVNKDADILAIKALAIELKIMMHLGKHLNVLNLLGACTGDVERRRFMVIVEYCRFGNIHDYLQKHRGVFIDQLTDSKESKNVDRFNRGLSSGSASVFSQFSDSDTQDTDPKRKVLEGYREPEQFTTYESDYNVDNPRPLASRDLLYWAYQIASGMEYLAKRKVLHGDLAARNVLLADDNIVKICDFGLARLKDSNGEYVGKRDCPLPFRWLAIECMQHHTFTTQSDVWAFGIVLWELFSLAMTPYPHIISKFMLEWLKMGNRLEKPMYANDRLYEIMVNCWHQDPLSRPTFSQLQSQLSDFIEDNLRAHVVNLNKAYMDANVQSNGEDYLVMACAPDYKHVMTTKGPTPHYAEIMKFPTHRRKDGLDGQEGQGSAQMNPESKQNTIRPRAQGTQFDFDASKLNTVSEATSCGSESTPMLTWNKLTARNESESGLKYLQTPICMSLNIEEETDYVTTNKNNATNGINMVTNPTYIAFDSAVEMQPKDKSRYTNARTGPFVPSVTLR